MRAYIFIDGNNFYFKLRVLTDRLDGKHKPMDFNFRTFSKWLTQPSALEGISYYRLKQTDFNGQVESFGPVMVNMAAGPEGIKIFPIPVAGKEMMLCLNDPDTSELLVVLYDIYGAEVFSKLLASSSGNGIFALDTRNKLPSGVYFVIGTTNRQLFRQKIVIQ